MRKKIRLVVIEEIVGVPEEAREVPPPVSAVPGAHGAVLVLVLWLGEPGVIRQIQLLIAPATGPASEAAALAHQDRLAGAVEHVAAHISAISDEMPLPVSGSLAMLCCARSSLRNCWLGSATGWLFTSVSVNNPVDRSVGQTRSLPRSFGWSSWR